MSITHTTRGPAGAHAAACSALLAGLLLLPIGASAAEAGDLDPHFGTDGRVTTDFGGDDYVFGVALQSNGRIVTAGQFSNPTNGTTSFALARYRRNGQLDTRFGGDGRVVTAFGSTAIANAVAIQPNGRIIAGGYVAATNETSVAPGASGFALTRYRPNGDLDTSFGHDGIVITGRRNLNIVYALALQPDGKIVAAGQAIDSSTGHSDFALVRYQRNGELDSSFGSHGVAITDFGGPNDYIRAIALQPDGKIVVAGPGDPKVGQIEFAVARYLPDGTPDVTFGTDGRVTTYVGDGYFPTALALQPDGKIVVGGQVNGFFSHFALVRYLADGALDPTFDSDGQVIADLGGSDHVMGLVLQPDGRIVAAGWSIDITTFERHFALARFLTNGALDTTFSRLGWVTTAVGSGGFAAANALVLQPNGKILTAGLARDSTGLSDFALARYFARTTGDGDTDDDVAADEDD